MFAQSYNERLFRPGLVGRYHIQRFIWLRDKISALGFESISVLEVGCYDARSIDYIPVPIRRYVGLDAGWESGIIGGKVCGLEAARQRFAQNKNYSFYQSANPKDLANIEEKFDVIVCMDTLECIKDSLIEPYVSAIASRLAGFLLITTGNEKGLPLLCKTLGSRLLGVNRNFSYTASEFVNALLGRMNRVPDSRRKGFDYSRLAEVLKRYFCYVRVEGINIIKVPVQLSLGVGMIASDKPV